MTGGGNRMAAAVALVLLAAAAFYLIQALGAGRGLPSENRQAAALDQQVREVASQLRCLQCQGLSAWESNTESSLQMRAEIREMLEQGMSPREIIDHYVERYGTWVLITPPFHGFGVLAYVVPAAGLVVGAVALRRLIRAGWAKPAAGAAGGSGADGSLPDRRRGTPSLLDEALRRFEGYDR